ncbi:hypothetical protein MC885_010503 [Smutsia gigantea]|nr:hypothetical protein MC885_010503 [Smutsia gigantea]
MPDHSELRQHPLRGTAEPFLRLHNSYPTSCCARQTTLPRLSRRVVSQHSYPLNCFSSVPLDPMEGPTSQADLELDYNPPRVQLSAGNFSTSSSFHHKTLAREFLLLEENQSLQEENKALHEKNKTLRKENKILQGFWEGHKTTVGWEESKASSLLLHKDNTSLEAAKKDTALQMHRSKENSTLQLLRQDNCDLQQLLKQRRAYWARVEKTAPAEEDKLAPCPTRSPTAPGCCRTRAQASFLLLRSRSP